MATMFDWLLFVRLKVEYEYNGLKSVFDIADVFSEREYHNLYVLQQHNGHYHIDGNQEMYRV